MLLNADEVVEKIENHSDSTPEQDFERVFGITDTNEQMDLLKRFAKNPLFSVGVIMGLCIALEILEEQTTNMPHDPFVNIP